MRKWTLALIAALLFSSCAVTKNGITGEFKGKTPWAGSFVPVGEMTLYLNSDQSFEINWFKTDYYGKWEPIDKDRVLLRFNPITDSSLFVRSGVILDSLREVRFINKNKLKMEGNTILKRQK